jgi:flagellar biosynthesis/type III secretory pathway protein FliH
VILRGAVMSEKRRSLDAESAELAAATQLRPTQPSPVPVAVAPTPPPITLDAVKTWLAGAGATARADLATSLADDIEALRSAARTQGIEAGRAEGLAQAVERARQALAALEKLVEQAEIAFDAATTELGTQCADIVCAVLAKIAGPQLATHEAALGAVLEVLKQVRDERALVIRVSPADIQALRAHEADIARACASRSYTLLADPRVDTGGCIVESALGGLDGRFDVQLRGVCETLRAAKSALAAAP